MGDMNIKVFFLHKTHCHDLFYRTVWSHENIQKRGHCGFNNQGKISQEV